MSPELFKENIYDYGVDIWALGSTVVEMLSGKSGCFMLFVYETVRTCIRYQVLYLMMPRISWEVSVMDCGLSD